MSFVLLVIRKRLHSMWKNINFNGHQLLSLYIGCLTFGVRTVLSVSYAQVKELCTTEFLPIIIHEISELN